MAPVAPRAALPVIIGRLIPIITIERDELVLLVMSLTTIPVHGFGRAVASLADRRDDIFAAIDYLFFGV